MNILTKTKHFFVITCLLIDHSRFILARDNLQKDTFIMSWSNKLISSPLENKVKLRVIDNLMADLNEDSKDTLRRLLIEPQLVSTYKQLMSEMDATSILYLNSRISTYIHLHFLKDALTNEIKSSLENILLSS